MEISDSFAILVLNLKGYGKEGILVNICLECSFKISLIGSWEI